ncbi:MAG: HAMP domain-containing protein, partial [Oscillospiraceae bacterium]|nr:HAMP domain-containing protein [Oscillospiraceae bacterium]
MFRSLHMKLVMIMLLLVTSLMAVVGAFLMTRVTNFYIDDFYQQMSDAFGDVDFVSSLRSEAAQDEGYRRIQSLLELYAGTLGIDSRNRNYYILDADTGEFLAGSDEEGGASLTQTANILTARNGKVGDKSDIASSFMDVAVPISGGENHYIIYIRDNRTTVASLNSQLLLIILQALLVGLLVSVLLSFLLAKTMIDPIEKLTEGAERIANGDFEEQLEVDSTDEIGILTTTFNDMASVLHETLDAVENERNKLDTLFLHMTDGVVAYDR